MTKAGPRPSSRPRIEERRDGHRAASRARAGTPSTVAPADTSLTTTAPAATTAPLPMRDPGDDDGAGAEERSGSIVTPPQSTTPGES